MISTRRWGAALSAAFVVTCSAGAFAQTAADLDAMWAVRDQPGTAAKYLAAADAAMKASPNSYDILWRAARWHCWTSDGWAPKTNPAREGEAKQCWDLAAEAVKLKPDGVEGNFWAGSGVGQWSDEVGIVKALTQGLEGIFNGYVDKALKLNGAYNNCDPYVLKGRYYWALPWPKRDLTKSAEVLNKGIALCPTRVRLYVFLADTELKDGDAKAAKATLEKAKTVGMSDDPPETRRGLKRLDETMKRVDEELK